MEGVVYIPIIEFRTSPIINGEFNVCPNLNSGEVYLIRICRGVACEFEDMGCFVSTPTDTGGNRRRPGNIGEVSVFIPGFRIPKPLDFSQSLGDHLSKNLLERLTALRTRIVVMAGHEAPTITRTRRKTATQHGLLWKCLKFCLSIW